jgi:hypothetical protein
MDVKGKIKDIIKAKMNMALFCHHKNIELRSHESQSPKQTSS